MSLQREGTVHELWQLTEMPHKPNVEVKARYKGSVTVGISNNGFGNSMELSAEEARAMAASLLRLADHAEEYEAGKSEPDPDLYRKQREEEV